MTDPSCIFCKIVRGEIPSRRVFENKNLLVFEDAYPQAKTHWLVIPKIHYTSLLNLPPDQASLVGEMFQVGIDLAKTHMPEGFRSVINTLSGGGQTVFHLHLHLMSGGTLSPRFA